MTRIPHKNTTPPPAPLPPEAANLVASGEAEASSATTPLFRPSRPESPSERIARKYGKKTDGDTVEPEATTATNTKKASPFPKLTPRDRKLLMVTVAMFIVAGGVLVKNALSSPPDTITASVPGMPGGMAGAPGTAGVPPTPQGNNPAPLSPDATGTSTPGTGATISPGAAGTKAPGGVTPAARGGADLPPPVTASSSTMPGPSDVATGTGALPGTASSTSSSPPGKGRDNPPAVGEAQTTNAATSPNRPAKKKPAVPINPAAQAAADREGVPDIFRSPTTDRSSATDSAISTANVGATSSQPNTTPTITVPDAEAPTVAAPPIETRGVPVAPRAAASQPAPQALPRTPTRATAKPVTVQPAPPAAPIVIVPVAPKPRSIKVAPAPQAPSSPPVIVQRLPVNAKPLPTTTPPVTVIQQPPATSTSVPGTPRPVTIVPVTPALTAPTSTPTSTPITVQGGPGPATPDGPGVVVTSMPPQAAMTVLAVSTGNTPTVTLMTPEGETTLVIGDEVPGINARVKSITAQKVVLSGTTDMRPITLVVESK